jgi:hypothetical protein
MGYKFPAHQEHTRQIRIENALPFAERKVYEVLAEINSRVVDKNLNLAEPFRHLGFQAIDLRFVFHVRKKQIGLPARAFNFALYVLKFAFIPLYKSDVCSGLAQRQSHRLSKSFTCAGDERDLSMERTRHLSHTISAGSRVWFQFSMK